MLSLRLKGRAITRGLRRAWSRVIGFMHTRKVASDHFIDSRYALERSADIRGEAIELSRDADERVKTARILMSSAQATVSDRDIEIGRLKLEKAQLEAILDLRKLEIQELNQWIERQRQRMNADIAQEVAREQRTIADGTRAPRS